MSKLSESKLATLWSAYRKTGSKTAAALEAGVGRGTAIRYLSTTKDAKPESTCQPLTDAPEPNPVTRKESGDGSVVEFECDHEIRTLEDAIAHAQVDTSVWLVDRWECGGWQVPMRVRQGQDEKGRARPDAPFVKQMWRVKLHLRRILPKPFLEASDAIFARMAEHAPAYPAVVRTQSRRPHLLEIGLFDAHFGKLAWARETGQDYDLALASRIFGNAVEDLIASARGFDVERILLPVGSDFFHVDNLQSSTTRGTRVDTDSRYAKMIEAGELAVIRAIERLLPVAPVSVVWIPGNHDRIASYHLARTLRAWFRQSGDVDVDCGPSPRKYFRWERNLIGLTHGDLEKSRSLPTIMAIERPRDWADVECREWHVGHYHKSKRLETVPVDTHDGVTVRTLQSLSGRDAWHHEQGYVGGRRAGEALLFAQAGGLVANFQATARED